MNERQRMEYLDTMGIDMYVPKWLLAGAAPPTEALLPSAEEESVPSETTKHTSVRESASFTSVKDLLSDTAEPVHQPSTSKAIINPTSSEMSQASEEVPEFALSVWCFKEKYMVVDSRHAALALPTDALLHNILLSLNLGLDRLPEPQIIRWPLVRNNSQHQGRAGAQEMVHSFLMAQLVASAIETVLLMGKEAQEYALGAELDQLEKKNDLHRSTRLGVQTILLPSLADLLQAPLEKRRVWQVLTSAQLMV